MPMTKASELADTLGRRAIADAVGVGLTAVSNAVIRGAFPSSWYVACQTLAAEKHCECPPALFGMKAGAPQDVNLSPDNKGAVE
jgi:hypothetical protein